MESSRRVLISSVSAMLLAKGVSADPLSHGSPRNIVDKGEFDTHLNVLDFGARGNGVADDSAAFQKAVDALPAHGGKICIPPNSLGYVIGDINCRLKAVEWVGGGGSGQSSGLGHGATELIVKDEAVGITFGDSQSELFRGPVLRDLRLVGQSPRARGGLLFYGISNAKADHVVCSNFGGPESFGWKFDGGIKGDRLPSTTMYNDLYACGANNCAVGMWGVRATGTRIFGGLFDANDNRANKVIEGTTAILWQSPGDTLAVFGSRFQSYATHILSSCPGTFISGTRHEAFDVGISVSSDYCTIMPGEMDNSFAGGGGTAITLESGKSAFVVGNGITAVATRINRGKATNFVIIDNGVVDLNYRDTNAGLVLGGDVSLYRPGGVPNVLRTDDQFRAKDGIVTKVVSGEVTDRSFVAPPADGTMAVDSLRNRLYVRVNGNWLFQTLSSS